MNKLIRSKAIMVAGNAVTVGSFEELEQRVEFHLNQIRKIENLDLAIDPQNADAWKRIAEHASILVDLLDAIEIWILEDDAALKAEIDGARATVRRI
jgi:DNA primase